MRPFEFIVLFFSFIYTLGLTHLLFAATRMIRHRRSLVFSWPHGLWMANSLVLLSVNWISLWDFHEQPTISLPTIVFGLVIVVVQYFVCALVSPDFEEGETYDLVAFHDREKGTYIGAFLTLLVVALAANFAAGAADGVQHWANQNALILVLFPFLLAPLFIKANWVQIGAPLCVLAIAIANPVLYYPVLK